MSANGPSSCDLAPAAKALYAVVCIMLVSTTAFVALRVYARVVRMKAFGWDDITLLLAYVINVALLSLNLAYLARGFGRHETCLHPATGSELRKLVSINQCLGIYSELFARLSIAILIIRLFAVSRRIRNIIIAIATTQCVIIGVTGILFWFSCSPPQSSWNFEIKHTCWSYQGSEALSYTNGVVSILSDLVAIVIPAYFMWCLRTRRTLRFLVVSLFAISLGPTACAIARMILQHELTDPDFSYGEVPLNLVFSLEVSLLVLCASAPAIPGIFRDKTKGSNQHLHLRDLTPGTSARPLDGTTSLSGSGETSSTVCHGPSKLSNRSLSLDGERPASGES